PENYSRPKHLLGVYHPLADTDWAEELVEAAEQFADVLTMRPPENMVVHIFTEREMGTAAIQSRRHAMRVRKQLKDELPQAFREGITIDTKGLTAVGSGRRFVIGKLVNDPRLLAERQQAIDIIPWELDPPGAE